jgi:hypothetical protein
MPERLNVEDVMVDLDVLELELGGDEKQIIRDAKRVINELLEEIERLRKGGGELPIPNRASQESGS